MELREKQFWKRKLGGYIWQIEALNSNGTVALVMWDDTPEREVLTREDFLTRFVPL